MIRAFLKHRRLELLCTGVAFVVYCAFSTPMLLKQSGAPHFVYLAEAFNHGRLWVMEPPNTNDWVKWKEHWYVSFPPFPAMLMMPFVALHGLAFNDVFFTVCVAAINVGFFLGVLRQYRDASGIDRPDWQLLVLTAFYAFGTVYFYTSLRGEVWFTAHVVGVSLTLLYLWAALDARHPIIAGLAMGCAAITRANLAFAFPFIILQALFNRRNEGLPMGRRIQSAIPRVILFGIPASLIFLGAMYMNHLRWDRWTEFGHGMLWNNRVNARVEEYGLMNVRYLPENFRSAFLMLPDLKFNPLRLGFDGNGMSMFITTPLLMLIPFTFKRSPLTLSLATTAFVTAIPGLIYMNNGWFQFGYRFSNDYLPYLFLLLALGKVPVRGFALVLGFLGVLVNTWGALVFSRL